ncbi:hypothetical protein D3C80_1600780 [compost metagenome]
MTAAFAATVLLDNHADIEAHQGAHIRRQAAVGGGHQNALPDPGHAHGHLLDTRIQSASRHVDTLEQLDFFSTCHHFQRIIGRV